MRGLSEMKNEEMRCHHQIWSAREEEVWGAASGREDRAPSPGGLAGLERELHGPLEIQVQLLGWSKLEKQLEEKTVRIWWQRGREG